MLNFTHKTTETTITLRQFAPDWFTVRTSRDSESLTTESEATARAQYEQWVTDAAHDYRPPINTETTMTEITTYSNGQPTKTTTLDYPQKWHVDRQTGLDSPVEERARLGTLPVLLAQVPTTVQRYLRPDGVVARPHEIDGKSYAIVAARDPVGVFQYPHNYLPEPR